MGKTGNEVKVGNRAMVPPERSREGMGSMSRIHAR